VVEKGGASRPPRHRPFRLLVLGCFFLSGAAGLVYEVVWARQLGLFLGITSFAHTAVITAYMAGLASGSLWFGRRADAHASPLQLYAWLEIGVGAYAALTPWMFDFLQAWYAGIAGVAGVSGMSSHLVRFAIALAALLVPTFLMGGTLPLLVRGFVREMPALGGATARLYGLNTLGATAGTLAAGFWLIPSYGLATAIYTGVALNLVIAALVLALLGRLPRVEAAQAAPRKSVREAPPGARPAAHAPGALDPRFAILTGFGMAGFASLLAQVAWIRALVLVIGGSVYAFTVTLASFLAGIGLGSLLSSRLLVAAGATPAADRLVERRLLQAGVLALVISLALLGGLAVIGRLPGWFLEGYTAGLHEHFGLFQLFIFLLCFSVMILPTLCMGALLPVVTVAWTRDAAATGRGVGGAYAINTVGTIFGALLGGLFILPWLGVHAGIRLAAALYLFSALLFWLAATNSRRPWARLAGVAGAALAFAVVVRLVPAWDRDLMSSGVFYRPLSLLARQAGDEPVDTELLYYAEGLDGTVTVKSEGGSRYLAINGKTDASSAGDLPTQVLLGRLPMQMGRQLHSALVIGLGSGITAGSIARSPEIHDLTVLEISAEVVVASTYFAPENYRVLADPRVRLVTADARNYLLAAERRFDLIVSEPSNPWISGISNLFTAEFFELAKSRLSDGGLMSQWFHAYSMSADDLKSVFWTFADTFEHVSVWRPLPGDLVMIGSRQPHALRLGDRGPPDGANAQELTRSRIFSDRDLVRLYLTGGDEIRRFAAGAKANSDARPVIEFSAPRNLYSMTAEENLGEIFRFEDARLKTVPVDGFYRVSGDGIAVPAMGVTVSLPGGEAPTDLRAEWVIGGQFTTQDGVEVLGVGSERRMGWREGAWYFDLRASWHREEQEIGDLALRLEEFLGEGALAGGEADLGAQRPAAWKIGVAGEGGAETRLALSWTCPSELGGVTRYLAAWSRSDVAPAAALAELPAFGRRFTCTGAAGASATAP